MQEYISTFSKVKSTTVKSNLSVKQMLNAIKTDNSGAKQIKRYTDGGVNISKYKTTYDKFKAIYVWHAKNFKNTVGNCVAVTVISTTALLLFLQIKKDMTTLSLLRQERLRIMTLKAYS